MDNKKNDFYDDYIHDGACLPEIAACLILDTDPKRVLQKDPEQFCGFIVKQENIKNLVILLKLLKLSNPTSVLNIFAYMDHTLKNNMYVSTVLLNKVSEFCRNKIPEDLKIFIIKLPYLSRALGINTEIIVNPNQSSSEIKYEEWQKIYEELKKVDSKITQAQAADKILEIYKIKNPASIKKSNGEFIEATYIIKNLKG